MRMEYSLAPSNIHAADTLYAGQNILDVDEGIVAEETADHIFHPLMSA